MEKTHFLICPKLEEEKIYLLKVTWEVTRSKEVWAVLTITFGGDWSAVTKEAEK